MRAIPVLFLFTCLAMSHCTERFDSERSPASAKMGVFNPIDFGAKPDGRTMNTAAIQKAIDACEEAGGGIVHFTAGTYLSGSVVIGAAMELHLEAGATLLASGDLADYREIPGKNRSDKPGDTASDSRGRKFHFLLVRDTEGFSITGKGTIDGNGKYFWGEDWEPLERPSPFIAIENSKRVTIRDVHVQNSPSHTIQFRNCNGVVIDGISIDNPKQSANTDGIDINDTRNVRISNCYLRSGDDLICLKSQRDTVENVVVTNCILESDDAAIKFGTGSQVSIRYCSFDNVVIRNSRYGVAMFMLDGGVFEHNRFTNITIENGGRTKHHYPIFIDVDKRVPDSQIGQISHLTFENIHIVSGGKVLISGHPESSLEYFAFRDVDFVLRDEVDFSDASKPRGNKNFPKTVESLDFATLNTNIVLGFVGSGEVDQIRTDMPENSGRAPIIFHESDILKLQWTEK